MGEPSDGFHVVVVGAGLAGMSAAWLLSKRLPAGARLTILEGRDRIGGRTLTDAEGAADGGVDLGAAWMWPGNNPSVADLARELAVETIPEGDGGVRFRGGSQALSLRIAEKLRLDDRVELRLGSVVESVRLADDRVLVGYRGAGEQRDLRADVAMVALPPRLVAESVAFEPALGDELAQVMRGTRTWMAQQAKFVAEYPDAFWKEQLGDHTTLYWSRLRSSGPLDMVFENGSTLWGFLSNEARWRSLPEAQRRDLALAQLSKALGKAALAPSRTAEADWAGEALTCSKADAKEPEPWQHPQYRHARVFQQGLWQERLWFLGSETAQDGAAGFLDGAVQSAQDRVKACCAAWAGQLGARDANVSL